MGMGRAEVGQGCEGLKGRGSHCRYQVWEEKRLREKRGSRSGRLEGGDMEGETVRGGVGEKRGAERGCDRMAAEAELAEQWG